MLKLKIRNLGKNFTKKIFTGLTILALALPTNIKIGYIQIDNPLVIDTKAASNLMPKLNSEDYILTLATEGIEGITKEYSVDGIKLTAINNPIVSVKAKYSTSSRSTSINGDDHLDIIYKYFSTLTVNTLTSCNNYVNSASANTVLNFENIIAKNNNTANIFNVDYKNYRQTTFVSSRGVAGEPTIDSSNSGSYITSYDNFYNSCYVGLSCYNSGSDNADFRRPFNISGVNYNKPQVCTIEIKYQIDTNFLNSVVETLCNPENITKVTNTYNKLYNILYNSKYSIPSKSNTTPRILLSQLELLKDEVTIKNVVDVLFLCKNVSSVSDKITMDEKIRTMVQAHTIPKYIEGYLLDMVNYSLESSSRVESIVPTANLTYTPTTTLQAGTSSKVTATLTLTSTEDGTYIINLPDGTEQSITLPAVNKTIVYDKITSNGTYNFTITSPTGHSVVKSITITNYKAPPTVNITSSSSMQSLPVKLNYTISSESSLTKVELYNGNTLVKTLPTSTTGTVDITTNGDYSIVATADTLKGSANYSVNIASKIFPAFTLDYTPKTLQSVLEASDTTIQLKLTSADGTYTIGLPDGSTQTFNKNSTTSIFSYNVRANGSYSFTVTSSTGETVTKSININTYKVPPIISVSKSTEMLTDNTLTISYKIDTTDPLLSVELVKPDAMKISLPTTQTGSFTLDTNGSYSIIAKTFETISATKEFTIDNIIPEVTITKEVTLAADKESATIKLNFTPTDKSFEVTTPKGDIINSSGFYTDIVQNNGTYTYYIKDPTGKTTIVLVPITTIIKPVALNYTVSTTLDTSDNITIDLNAISDDTITKITRINADASETKIGTDTASIEVSNNGVYKFKAYTACNVSDIVSVTIDNIVKTPTINYDIKYNDARSQAEVTVTYHADLGLTSIDLDGDVETFDGSIKTYTKKATFTSNGTYTLSCSDTTSKASGVNNTTFTINGISEKPSINFRYDATRWYVDDVPIDIDIKDNTSSGAKGFSRISLYKVTQSGEKLIKELPNSDNPDTLPETYTLQTVATENATYKVEAISLSGQENTATKVIARIDKINPTIDLDVEDINEVTLNKKIQIATDDNVGIYKVTMQYNEETPVSITDQQEITIDTNGTYTFTCMDFAGNTDTKTVTINTIETLADITLTPEISVIPVDSISKCYLDLEFKTLSKAEKFIINDVEYTDFTETKEDNKYVAKLRIQAEPTVYKVKAISKLGLERSLADIVIDCIDTNEGTITVEGEDFTEWTPSDIQVKVTATDSSTQSTSMFIQTNATPGLIETNTNNTLVQYFTIKENGTYKFRAVDAWGNVTNEVTKVITKIDKDKSVFDGITVADKKILINTRDYTSQVDHLVLSIYIDNNLVKSSYKPTSFTNVGLNQQFNIDLSEYIPTGKHIVKVTIQAVDKANNYSDVQTKEFSVISNLNDYLNAIREELINPILPDKTFPPAGLPDVLDKLLEIIQDPNSTDEEVEQAKDLLDDYIDKIKDRTVDTLFTTPLPTDDKRNTVIDFLEEVYNKIKDVSDIADIQNKLVDILQDSITLDDIMDLLEDPTTSVDLNKVKDMLNKVDNLKTKYPNLDKDTLVQMIKDKLQDSFDKLATSDPETLKDTDIIDQIADEIKKGEDSIIDYDDLPENIKKALALHILDEFQKELDQILAEDPVDINKLIDLYNRVKDAKDFYQPYYPDLFDNLLKKIDEEIRKIDPTKSPTYKAPDKRPAEGSAGAGSVGGAGGAGGGVENSKDPNTSQITDKNNLTYYKVRLIKEQGAFSTSKTYTYKQGEKITITYNVPTGYRLGTVYINNEEVSDFDGTYTIESINHNYDIYISVLPKSEVTTYKITPISYGGGTLSEVAPYYVNKGDSTTIQFTANQGYKPSYMYINGLYTNINGTQVTLKGVNKDITIEVIFEPTEDKDGELVTRQLNTINKSKVDYIKYTVGSKTFSYNNVLYQSSNPVQILDDVPYIELSSLLRVYGVKEDNVSWNPDTKIFSLYNAGNIYNIKLGSSLLYKNGEVIDTGYKLGKLNGRLMISIPTFIKLLKDANPKVIWDQDTGELIIQNYNLGYNQVIKEEYINYF